MFIAAVSEFDQTLEEDGFTNSLDESLQLFETILASDFFASTPIILFLNKKDVLEEKLRAGIKISVYFPDYIGPEADYFAVMGFIADQFAIRNKDKEDRPLYVHQTCATDTQNIRVVFSVVEQLILDNIFSQIGYI